MCCSFGGGARRAVGALRYDCVSMPLKRSNPKAMHSAGLLRRRLTPAEAKLWTKLRGNQLESVSFRRQHAIGPYIADFCAPKAKLVIELDGGQHTERAEYDAQRTAYLEKHGYRVIRFWNNEVLKNIEGVWQVIEEALKERR